jgi:mannose-6-phosphate isomerase-like protein (cupin superfamily)
MASRPMVRRAAVCSRWVVEASRASRWPQGAVSCSVHHRTVEQIWYVLGGSGQMWRAHDGREAIDALGPGVCLTIPLGTHLQFRALPAGLRVLAVTLPPWPDDEEAAGVPRHWPDSRG